MPDFDLLINITNRPISTHVGHVSKYGTSSSDGGSVHPGTGNKIEGWKWGMVRWPTYYNLSEFSYLPGIFDSSSNIPEHYYQSGFGYDTDILMKGTSVPYGSLKETWNPQINSGNYYIYDKEWYLFSDQHVTETLVFPPSTHTLEYKTKQSPLTPTPPIFIRRFTRDEDTSRLLIADELTYTTVDAGVDPGLTEFALDTSTPSTGTKLLLNPALTKVMVTGETFTLTSDITVVELASFPIDESSTTAEASPGVSSGSDLITDIDYDLGHIRLPANHSYTSLVVDYKEDFSVIYEPEFASDTINAISANVNPVHNGTNTGFVQITTEILEPYTIELEADLPVESTTLTGSTPYLLDLGNNTAKLTATVKNRVGTLLEGIRVYFEWDLPIDLSSVTDHNGKAIMYFSSPANISDIGEYIYSGDVTFTTDTLGNDIAEMTVANVPANTLLEDIWIYAIHMTDPFFGLKNAAAITDYFETYLEEEGITDGTANAAQQLIEEKYREANFPDLFKPSKPRAIAENATQGEANKKKGLKRLILEEQSDNDYINPYTGVRATSSNKVWWPIKPTIMELPVLTYDASASHFPDTTERQNINAYFIVSNHNQSIRAYAYNNAGQRIYSNTIVIEITIPDSRNGTFYRELMSSLDANYIANLLSGESTLPTKVLADLGLYPEFVWDSNLGEYVPATVTTPAAVTAPSNAQPGKIPLGFRILGSNITVASFLDQVTFINPHGTADES